MAKEKKIVKKAVLWDLDGTIASTEIINIRAHQETMSELDVVIPIEVLIPFAGLSIPEIFKHLSGKHRLTIGFDEYRRKWQANRNAIVNREGIQFMPGALPLLVALEKAEVPQGLVTSAHKENVDQVMGRLNIERFFIHVVCRQDVVAAKPDPEGYLLARAKFENPLCCVAIEDSDSGVAAAYAAGIPVVGVRTEENARHLLKHAHAVVDLRETQHVLDMIRSILTPH